MQLAKAALDAGNPDEAYGYFTRVLENNPADVEAWLGKAEAAGRAGTLRNPRMSEVQAGVRQAVTCSAPQQQAEVKRRGAMVLTQSAVDLFGASQSSLAEYAALDNAWPDHVAFALEALGVLAEARALDPSAPEPVMETIEVCRVLLAGHRYFAQYDENEGWRVHRLAPQNEARVRPIYTECVEVMRRMDPSWVAPAIQGPKSGNPIGVVVGVVVALVVVIAVIAMLR
jgi:tetratricopeptide (TPR) repeat protein